MLYREIIAVCSQIHTKHINTLCGQNVELPSVKPGGTYSDHCALKCVYNWWALKFLRTFTNCLCPNYIAASRYFTVSQHCSQHADSMIALHIVLLQILILFRVTNSSTRTSIWTDLPRGLTASLFSPRCLNWTHNGNVTDAHLIFRTFYLWKHIIDMDEIWYVGGTR